MKRVYIASPYSSNKVGGTIDSIEMANKLMDAGYTPFVPLLSHFWDELTPRPYDDWLRLNIAWVKVSEVVLRMPGASSGADKEVALAKSLNIPVVYSFEELMEKYPCKSKKNC